MSYTPSQLAVLSGLRSPLRNKPMPAEITEIDVNTSGSGHEQAVITIAPVEKGVKQSSLALKMYVSKVDDSIAANPQSLGRVKAKAYSFFRTVDSTFPTYPEKVSNGVYRDSSGATLTYDEYNKRSNEVTKEIFTRLEAMSKDTLKPFVGTKVFMCPQEATLDMETKRSSQFVGWIANELKDGQEFLTADLVDEDLLKEFITKATAEEAGA